MVDEPFWVELATLELELGGPQIARDLFLLCPRRNALGGARFFHYRGMQPRSVSRWWYDRLEEAGVLDAGARSGMGMHRGRHTVASDILRKTGNIVAAAELLGHADIETTRRAYASFDTNDLADVLRALRTVE